MPNNTFDWQKTYPGIVSRTLDPSNKSLVTIVALHDKQITDADINLLQDSQDYKRRRMLDDNVTSGCLTYTPFNYLTAVPNTFYVPGFDILFNGEIVTVTGQNSTDLTQNAVQIPNPSFWAQGVTAPDAAIYIAFVEIWYQALNPLTGVGYYTDILTGLRYFFPYGGINPATTNANILPDDVLDPFQGLFTTERAQIQWRINVQPVALSYDFTKYQFGLDPGAIPTEIVYAQASQAAPLSSSPIYQFTNMGAINGDTGVWRAGDGNVNNSLGTMDGYSYAFPLAVIFQKNSGYFDIVNNPLGCADSNPPSNVVIDAGHVNGLLSSGVSGRYDSKLADQISPDNVVDTRSTVALAGWDMDLLCRNGFGDLVQGKTQLALSRGVSPGNSPEVVGSSLGYYVAMAPPTKVFVNADKIGAWDGFSNGFSSDVRTYISTVAVSINQKSLGSNGSPWVSGATGDAFTVSLPTTSQAVISTISVTALNTNTVTGTKAPAALLQGQVSVNGLGSKSVTVQLIKNLTNTPFDPGNNNIYATIGVQYPAGTNIDLRHVPTVVDGGQLYDNVSGITMPVFGCSEYQVQQQQTALQAFKMWAINPEYSDVTLGTRIWVILPSSAATQQTVGGQIISTYIINRQNMNHDINGFYAVNAGDLATGAPAVVLSRVMNGLTHVLTIQGAPPDNLVVSMLAQNTAQLAYNAPVRGVTVVEETVLMGNYTSDPNFPMDPRINVVSVGFDSPSNTTTIVLDSNQCQIKGIAGDDVQRFIWVSDNTGNLNAVTLQSVSFSNGILTAVVSGNLTVAPAPRFFFAGSILPAFDTQSSLIVQEHYIPYQGEGIVNRDYEFVHTEDNALVTTNGTGTAPIVGLQDIYPYNRELPIAIMMPSQSGWNDATLTNEPLASFFDSNYVAMRFNNVEHTFLAPMHTNDFVPPVNKDIRKTVRFLTQATGGRGWGTAIPHLGFAIAAPTPRTVLGQNLQATTAPITLYVNNQTGSDSLTGLTKSTAKLTIQSAMSELPPVLRHPCVIQLIDTGAPYLIKDLQNNMEQIATGDGISQSAVAFALANLSRVVQDAGRLVISVEAGSTNQIVIDSAGFSGFGSGPTYAFYTDTSRVIFNGLQFKNFQNSAIKAKNADVQFVNCGFTDNNQAASFEEACGVIFDGGSITLPDSGVGMIATGGTTMTATSMNLTVEIGASPAPFYVVERASTLNLQTHSTSNLEETNISATTVVAQAEINSSIVCTADFQTAGSAIIEANSVLARTVQTNPFLGGVTIDPSSEQVTQL